MVVSPTFQNHFRQPPIKVELTADQIQKAVMPFKGALVANHLLDRQKVNLDSSCDVESGVEPTG